MEVFAEEQVRVLKGLFDLFLDIFFGCVHDRFGPENVISVSEIVQHDTHCCRGYEMTMLTMTVKQADYLYISVQNREETILVSVTLPALCHHRRPKFERVPFN